MADLFKLLRKKSNPGNFEKETHPQVLEPVCSFLGKNYEQVLMIGFVVANMDSYESTLSALKKYCSPYIDDVSFLKYLLEFVSEGWLEFDGKAASEGRTEIRLSHHLRLALENKKFYILNRQLDKLKADDKEFLTLYTHAMCFMDQLITLVDWQLQCLLFIRNSSCTLAKRMREISSDRLSKSATVLVCLLHIMSKAPIELGMITELFTYTPIQGTKLYNEWNSCESGPLASGLLEVYRPSEEFVALTCNAQMLVCTPPTLSPEEKKKEKNLPSLLTRTKAGAIAEQKLLYNSPVQKKCEELFRLLSSETFAAYENSMKKMQKNAGITILLSGGPGTGKTELARQIARTTGRELLTFEVSEQREKYVGESEKKVKLMFDYYASRAEQPESTPILFINEADSIFQQRTGFDKSIHEIAVQAILLNEMEKFRGIMICTTNNPQLFDPAYARRFLFRIDIDAPDQDTRALLLSQYFPELNPDACRTLAKKHLFSGAQLINFIKQRHIHSLIYPELPALGEPIDTFLESEATAQSGIIRPTVGYRMGHCA